MTDCRICPVGYYSKVGSQSCQQCPSGTFTNHTGSSFCSNCTIGYCTDGIECKPCSPDDPNDRKRPFNREMLIIGVSAGGTLIVVILLIFAIVIFRRRRLSAHEEKTKLLSSSPR
eukprot:TRINITY_DN7351_c0_g1_i1.p1 TRINITY_DN7351_c0_g1~~TRINITY_DN7351_c0_g1_i1.p1  ORF type:complete len:115 (-),score=12.90 TRINITY_DN7351_c0_g1_i1:4-348(-)